MAKATEERTSDYYFQERYKQFHAYDFGGDEKFQSGWEKVAKLFDEDDEKSFALLKAKLFFYSKVYETVSMSEYTQWLKMNRKEIDGLDLKGFDCLSSKIGTPNYSLNQTQTVDSREHDCGTKTDLVESSNTESEFEAKQKVDMSCKSEIDSEKYDPDIKHKVICESTKCYGDSKQNIDSGKSERKTSSELICETTNSQDIEEVKNLNFEQIAEMLDKGLKLPGIEDLQIEPTNADPTPSSMKRIKKPWEK